MRRAGRHVTAWTLALMVSASVVAARVVGEPETAASESEKSEKVKTVTVTVTTPAPAPARTMRTAVFTTASSTRASKKCRTKKQKRSKKCRKKKRKAPPKIETVDGDSFATRYGPVQVRLKLQGSKIVDSIAIVYPNDIERTKQISADCLPKLRQQVLSAQSAKIDGVAGATYTADGYKKSVQSALDLS